MTRRHLLYLILCVGGLCLVLYYTIYRHSPQPVGDGGKGSQTLGTSEKNPMSFSNSDGSRSVSQEREKTFKALTSPEAMTDKWARVEALYDSLTEADWEGVANRNGPHPKKVEILTEGMDAFTAAKYLASEGRYSDHLFEYAERAVAENPGDFEVLLFYARKHPYYREEEAEEVYRQLLAMAPNSIEVLHELGRVLMYRKPAEAVVHIKKVIAMEPSSFEARMNLGWSYRELGRLDEALATFQAVYKIRSSSGAMNGINLIKGDMEWYRANNMQWETAPEEPPPAEISPEVPPQDFAPSIPDIPDRLEGEAAFDDEPRDFTPPGENSGLSAAEQRDIDALIRIIEEYEASITSRSDPSAIVEGQITDLERSVESGPNRAESYLELARAYEEAGEHEKAAEIYRRARERFQRMNEFNGNRRRIENCQNLKRKANMRRTIPILMTTTIENRQNAMV